MSKVYVVLARNYEYNDEGYDVTDGGNVVRAYTSQAAAETARVQMNIESLRDRGMVYLAEKCVELDEDAYGILEKHDLLPEDGDYFDYYEAENVNDAIRDGRITEDDLRILARGMGGDTSLYFIQEVEVE